MVSFIYNKSTGRDCDMKKKKHYFTDAEWRFIIHSLNTLRNNLIQAGRYTDVVDETLVKLINAPVRKVRVS
jgi:hypothetical protein